MGLDQYAYTGIRPGQREEFYETAEKTEHNGWVSDRVEKPRELMYWRKHPGLQGFFKAEWESQGNKGDFNGDELEITWDMLERLEDAVRNGKLPPTTGFFYGDNSDQYYRDQDLEFCRLARAELFMKLRVFYNSSW